MIDRAGPFTRATSSALDQFQQPRRRPEIASMIADVISRSRRRHLRFSIRWLIAVVLVLGAWFGWIVRNARIQRAAVVAIEKSGGTAHYNWTWNNGSFINAGKPWVPQRLVDLLGVDYFGHITYVRLRATSDELLAHVGRLDRLQCLHIADESDINGRLAST